ncbi:MAG: ABC transporter permease [Betaproteobacteria bacterium]
MNRIVILGGLLALWLVFGALSPVFFTVENMLNLARIAGMNGLLALGMTLVIIAGGIDLSVGSMLALGGAVGAGLLGASYGSTPPPVALPAWLAVLTAVAVCGLAGLMSGLAIVKLDLAPFVVTLGMMTVARGLTYVFSDFIMRSVPGTAITFSHPQFEWLGSGALWSIPAPAVIFLVTISLAALMLRYTTFGRNIYAVGGNAELSRLAGINTGFVLAAAYAISGALAGLSGVVFTARLASASPLAGVGYELDAIAAVVIGGTSMTGGEGGVWRRSSKTSSS